jgi:hypothetical protein
MGPKVLLGTIALLVFRGMLLWLVLPPAVLTWLIVAPYARRRGVSLGAVLGWVDLNLVACLQRSVLRPLAVTRMPWTHLHELPYITHRVRLLDPA